MNQVLLTHPGTQYSYQLAKGLYKRNLLYEFWTGFIIPENSFRHFLFKLLPDNYRKKIANRILSHVPERKIRSMPFMEFSYLQRSANGDQEQLLFERNKKFQESIPVKSISNSDAVIGFDTSSWILADRVHKAGKKFILDQSIAHPRSKEKIYKQLNEKYPEWSEQLKTKKNELIRIEEQEHQLADFIVVASTFTKNTLTENNVDASKILVNPYGVDLTQFSQKKYTKSAQINFVFIGSITARKGIPYLLEVWNEIDRSKAVLNMIGPCDEKIKKLIPPDPSINYLGKIPHSELSSVIAQNDVFLFPSFFEGFGLVILEAMAIGLPVITTPATAGPDVIREGEDGFIVDVFDKRKLIEKINYFIENPDAVEKMGRNARQQAEKFSWDAYYDRWENIIQLVC
jgi:alpha-maltose-1-phosphate synthase